MELPEILSYDGSQRSSSTQSSFDESEISPNTKPRNLPSESPRGPSKEVLHELQHPDSADEEESEVSLAAN
jgi:hypothetical protein